MTLRFFREVCVTCTQSCLNLWNSLTLCTFQAINEEDGYLHLMSDDGDIREDLKAPEGEIDNIREMLAKANADSNCTVTVSVFLLGGGCVVCDFS